jgi:ABC-type bacteriocin/lantibiotic exporter with double-glycine peptidase domain
MKFPYHKQETDYTCGAACMRMTLEYFGIKKSERHLAKLLGTSKFRGTWLEKLGEVADRFRLDYDVLRHSSVADIKRLQKEGFIVIVCYWYPEEGFDHYSVVKKIRGDYIYFWDPYFGSEHKYKISYFLKIWEKKHHHDKEKRWLVAIKRAE